MEQWKQIKGFERYEISEQWKVRAVLTGRVIKTQYNGTSETIYLSHAGISYKRYIGAIIADTFDTFLIDGWYTIEVYNGICREVTEKALTCSRIDTTERGFKRMHVDHIIPVSWGWKNKISPHLLGMSANLNMMYWRDNLRKGNSYKLLL